ncbi:MFS transporter [Streptomyces sp. NPDC048288]|uniref:MFS transporter n=1 Tax=Streptomyces sp. NPDC048288 TaxID=3365529 RepID=UPI003710C235
MAVIPDPAPAGAPYEPSAAQAPASDEPGAPAGTAYVRLPTIAQLSVYMTLVTPIGLSLSIRVSRLAPHHEEYLGYVTGVGGFVAVVAPPVVGRLSDRTRNRFSRRRPYLAAATVVGVAALVVLAEAPGLLVLGLGWAMAQLGWGTVVVLLASQADRLPTDQRGTVSGPGRGGHPTRPVVGVLIAGSLPDNKLLLFLAPGVLGVLGMAVFVGRLREPDNRATRPVGEPFSRTSLVADYMFSPQENPDFAWNWLGKFLVMFGLSLTSTFTAFFLADRQNVNVHDVARTVVALSGGSMMALAPSSGPLRRSAAQQPRRRPVPGRRPGTGPRRATRPRHPCRPLHRHLQLRHHGPAGNGTADRAAAPLPRRRRRRQGLHAPPSRHRRVHPRRGPGCDAARQVSPLTPAPAERPASPPESVGPRKEA